MRLAVPAAGSRGDIKPHLALGVGLPAAGRQGRCAAVVSAPGLEFAPGGAGFQAVRGGGGAPSPAFMADQPSWAGVSLSRAAACARSYGTRSPSIGWGWLEQALIDRALPQRAAQIGQRIRSEDGIVRVVQLIESLTAESG